VFDDTCAEEAEDGAVRVRGFEVLRVGEGAFLKNLLAGWGVGWLVSVELIVRGLGGRGRV